jgi:glycosyltransferase involved in cell wall biosynthesis
VVTGVVCVGAGGSLDWVEALSVEAPVIVEDAESLAREVAAMAPRDVVVVLGPARLSEGWFERLLQAAASGDDEGVLASVGAVGVAAEDFDAVAQRILAAATGARPRVDAIVTPAVLLRGRALGLVGGLDPGSPSAADALRGFGRRCSAFSLTHLVADDVVVAGPEIAFDVLADGGSNAEPTGRVAANARRRVRGAEVTIDARTLGPGSAGTKVHTIELIAALARTEALRLRVVLPPDAPDDVRAALAEHETVAMVTYEEAVQRPERTDLVHRPYQVYTLDDLALLRLLGDRVVVTYQDSILYRTPEYFEGRDDWDAFRRVTRIAMAAAERVIFESRHVLNEALRDELIDEKQAVVVPIGTDHHVTGAAEAPRRPDVVAPELASSFLLCLGSDLRHKNRPFALRLLAALRDAGWDGKLVLAGAHVPHGSSRAEEDELLAESPALAEAVLRLGPVDAGERAWLMDNCAALVYPSVDEGFGLVPFEAGHAGIPCLFAPQGALAEMAGDDAALVAWDPEASAARVLPLLAPGPERERHVAALRAAADRYTWDEAARRLLEVYEAALAGPARAPSQLAWESAEREHRMLEVHGEYMGAVRALEEMRATIGEDGIALVGTGGTLPEEIRRPLLAVTARRPLRAVLFAAVRVAYRLGSRRSP